MSKHKHNQNFFDYGYKLDNTFISILDSDLDIGESI